MEVLQISRTRSEISGSELFVKRLHVVVPWPHGLHLRPASRLVQVARGFHSTVILKCGGKVADLRSLLGIVALCATLGTGLEVEVEGDDEQNAVEAVERLFKPDATDHADLM